MSSFTTLVFGYPSSVSPKTGKRRLSSSMETTFSARFASSTVSTPIPGPTSNTPMPGPTPHSSAIRGHTEGLMRKFCPKDLENVNPCLANSAFTADGSDSRWISCKMIPSERPKRANFFIVSHNKNGLQQGNRTPAAFRSQSSSEIQVKILFYSKPNTSGMILLLDCGFCLLYHRNSWNAIDSRAKIPYHRDG